VAVSLDRVNESVRRVYALFAVLAPASLALVGAVSWFMARRSLAPIGRVARTARQLTIASFDRRIPVPPGRDEVSEMVVTINSMLDRLESGFRAHERFIADAAHELKTPVAVLLAESQVLARQARTAEEYDAFVASVEGEMRRLTQIIDSLLILARANAGYPIALASEVSLNDVVSDAVQRCDALAGQREIRLVPLLYLPGPADPEPLVRGDDDLLASMIGNLIRNAIRSSPVGGTVEVQLEVHGRAARVAVRDRGPGIAPEYAERIFEEFFRVPGADQQGGAGLGLAIAKGVARLHGGSIDVANRQGGGCEFTIRLPLCPPDEKTFI
jgi:two-component system OmpR family sensor kinase